jgi:hypothetical protein
VITQSTGVAVEGLSGGDIVLGLEVLPTPGHTAGHLSLFDPASSTMLLGDVVGNVGRGFENGVPSHDEPFVAASRVIRELLQTPGLTTTPPTRPPCRRVVPPSAPTRAMHTAWVIPIGRCSEDSGSVADTAAPPRSLAVPLTAFAVGAVVAVLVGVFGKVHDPTLQGTTSLWFRTVIDMKVVLATVVGVLAVLQIFGGLWIYGRLGRPAPPWVGTAHRISGAVAVVLAVFVAYSCLWALGLESGTLKDGEPVGTRTVVHGVLGCAVMGAFVVKAAAVRARRAPGWFLPLAGGLLFALLIAAVLTSAGWYLSTRGWPTSA